MIDISKKLSFSFLKHQSLLSDLNVSSYLFLNVRQFRMKNTDLVLKGLITPQESK